MALSAQWVIIGVVIVSVVIIIYSIVLAVRDSRGIHALLSEPESNNIWHDPAMAAFTLNAAVVLIGWCLLWYLWPKSLGFWLYTGYYCWLGVIPWVNLGVYTLPQLCREWKWYLVLAGVIGVMALAAIVSYIFFLLLVTVAICHLISGWDWHRSRDGPLV